MQADDPPQFLIVLKLLENIGECAFDLSLDGPRLRSIFFGSQSNQNFVENCHHFIGELVCRR